MTLDTMQAEFPDVPYVFGLGIHTGAHGAENAGCAGEIEGSDRARPMRVHGFALCPPNVAELSEGRRPLAIRFSNEVYERLLGFCPKSFWNPECGWRSYVPAQVVEAGYINMIGDFEAYSRSCGPDGKPLRPEIHAVEYNPEPAFSRLRFQLRSAWLRKSRALPL